MRDRLVLVLALACACAIVPPAVLHFVGREKVSIAGSVHFGAVGASALVATAAALVLVILGARTGDARVVLVGSAFAVMGALLAVHGLGTPNLIIGYGGLVALTGALTLPAGAGLLALSALPHLRRPEGVRPLLFLLGLLLVVIASLSAVGFADPSLVPSVPQPFSPAALALLATGLLFFTLLALRGVRTFLLTHRPSDLLVCVGIAWLAAALVAALTLDYSKLGWWLGHSFELAGIAFIGAAVAYDFARGGHSRPLQGDLRGAELVERQEALLGSQVRALTDRLAEKDAYTREHTRRVALLATAVGDELGLPPRRLRTLAIAGLLHDIGKLSLPDSILKKPGPLTEDEYRAVCRHPERGARLLAELGFPAAVCTIVRAHHERLDGSGYPRRLGNEDIDLETGVLAVCDVYDALRSRRVYREAFSHEQALDILVRGSGTLFDPRCVGVLADVLSAQSHERVRLAARPVATPIAAA